MTQNELNKILADHAEYLASGGERGVCADLSGADLSGADLRGAGLTYANLTWADLRGADLSGAELFDADLKGAELCGADLKMADLSRANLSGADLSRADLKGAVLTWATTSDAKGIRTIGVQVTTSRQNNMITYYPDLDIVTTGCFQGTMDELKAKVEEKHKGNPFLLGRYRRAIAFIEAEEEAERERDEQIRA